jgi:hypothetical protein
MKPLVRLAPPFQLSSALSTCFAASTTTSARMKLSLSGHLPVPSLFPRAAIRAHYCASQSTLPGIKQLASIEQWHVVFEPLSLGWIPQTPTLRFTPTKGRMADLVEKELSQKLSGTVLGLKCQGCPRLHKDRLRLARDIAHGGPELCHDIPDTSALWTRTDIVVGRRSGSERDVKIVQVRARRCTAPRDARMCPLSDGRLAGSFW